MSDCQYNGGHGIKNGHEWVDLGLSVKWATCNVGAKSPSDYGNYYAWGEVKTKAKYDLTNCFDCLDSNGKTWETYKVGGLTTITPASGHDAARENWGSTWRMPSSAEFDELCKKCEWRWTSKNGHNGYLVTGPNKNSVFLPVAGCHSFMDAEDVGESGYYWSSSLSSISNSSEYASILFFSKNGNNVLYYYRWVGLSVRAVLK